VVSRRGLLVRSEPDQTAAAFGIGFRLERHIAAVTASIDLHGRSPHKGRWYLLSERAHSPQRMIRTHSRPEVSASGVPQSADMITRLLRRRWRAGYPEEDKSSQRIPPVCQKLSSCFASWGMHELINNGLFNDYDPLGNTACDPQMHERRLAR
jgi:hypothetical protein